MVCLAASAERTETQWLSLSGGVGLRINGVWTKGEKAGSLIEAVLEG